MLAISPKSAGLEERNVNRSHTLLFGATVSHNSAPGIPVLRGGDIPVMNPGASSSFDSDVVIQHFM
jgi:hypothetical protein